MRYAEAIEIAREAAQNRSFGPLVLPIIAGKVQLSRRHHFLHTREPKRSRYFDAIEQLRKRRGWREKAVRDLREETAHGNR